MTLDAVREGGHAGIAPIETERLRIRPLTLSDADFILGLVNEPSWLRYIGDKGVRNLEDAGNYLRNGPLAMYQRLGFGLCAVEQRDGGAPMGICGLIKRDVLDDVDIGFAFLPTYAGRGYAREAAAAVLAQGMTAFGLARVLAITSPDNERSIRLLESLGFRFERLIRLTAESEEVRLFAYPG